MAEYQYRGARASIILHEEEIRRFIEAWRKAKAAGIEVPPADNIDYTTLETLLGHVLGWAGKYLVWICEQLDLPAPPIDPVPGPEELASLAESHAEKVLEAWDSQLRDVATIRFFKPTYNAPWGVPYCIDSMLEHAVMHPLKHRFQLEELMGER